MEDEDEARNLTRELHSTTHLGRQALWKLFRDRYEFMAGRRICLEVAQSCPQCQLGSDYGHRQKTMGAIQSHGPWDTLSIDIVGPLPADHHQEFLTVFVDCYSRHTILVPSSNHTANTVSEALLRLVIPYIGTPRRLLSDHGREFISEIWTKLLRSLGIQRVLTSPYHPEGNAINERSHRTLNNMLRTRLLEGFSSKAWVEKVPGIMLDPQRQASWASRVLSFDDSHRSGTKPPSWRALGRPCFTRRRWSLRVCWSHNPAAPAHSPTTGFSIPASSRQPLSSRKPHLCPNHTTWARL